MKLPFDSLSVCCAVSELQPWLGAKIERFFAFGPSSFAVQLYGGPDLKSKSILINWSSQFGRIHLANAPKRTQHDSLNHLLECLRSQCDGGILAGVTQVGGDRLVDLVISRHEVKVMIHCELTGRNSNVIVTTIEGRILACARTVHRSQSARPIAPNMAYSLPPGIENSDELKFGPFCQNLMKGSHLFSESVLKRKWHPCLYPEHGCYPVSVPTVDSEELHFVSFCEAADRHYQFAEIQAEFEQRKAEVLGRLKKRLNSIEHTMFQLTAAVEQGNRSRHLQWIGNQLLAQPDLQVTGIDQIQVDGTASPETIRLDSELTLLENANRYFERAKRALARLPQLRAQLQAFETQKEQVSSLIARVERSKGIDELQEVGPRLDKEIHHGPKSQPERKRPYDGFKIKEFTGPNGESILVGENAPANDFLVSRLGKPNDWWLHVRGVTSAHVLILTGNQPDKTSRETLLFAAELSARNSVSKHSSLVSVDYTLKKFVRRQKGAKPGSVTYTNERTLTVHLKS